MDPELETLQQYLVQLMREGNTERARVVGNEIRRLQHNAQVDHVSKTLVPGVDMSRIGPNGEILDDEAAAERRLAEGAAAGRWSVGGAAPEGVPPDTVRLGLEYSPEAGTGAGGTWDETPAAPSAREQGRASVADISPSALPYEIAGTQLGNMFFGAGTGISALGEFLTSNLRGAILPGEEGRSWGESLEFARGRTEGLFDTPGAAIPRIVGGGAGMVGGVAAARAVAGAGIPVVSRVAQALTPVEGQTVRNIARVGTAGAGGAATTAAIETGREGVIPAAAAGAVLGPAIYVGGSAGVGAFRRFGIPFAETPAARATRNAVNELRQVLTENASTLQRNLQSFQRRWGDTRIPALSDLIGGESAERVGTDIARKNATVTRVLRERQEALAEELPSSFGTEVRRGGPTETLPGLDAAPNRAPEIAGEAEDLLRRRLGTTSGRIEARRDFLTDDQMAAIGHHNIPIDDDMLRFIQSGSVWGNLPDEVRQVIAGRITQGQAAGSIAIPIREMEAIRQSLRSAADAENVPFASNTLNDFTQRLRGYVSNVAPEYDQVLTNFARRSAIARGFSEGEGKILSEKTTSFIDRFRRAGGGLEDRLPNRTGAEFDRAREQLGQRLAARSDFLEELTRTPEEAAEFMQRFTRDRGLQDRAREVFSRAEFDEFSRLATDMDNYLTNRLNVRANVQAGREILDSDTETFQDAVRLAQGRSAGSGFEAGARGAVAGAVEESASAAVTTGRALAGPSGGLQARIAETFGEAEAMRLAGLGADVLQSAENIARMTPQNIGEGAFRELSQVAKDMVGTVLAIGGRTSVAMQSGIAVNLMNRLRLSEPGAQRLAQMLTDPDLAEEAIDLLRRANLNADEILRIYRDAAIGSGLIVGSDEERVNNVAGTALIGMRIINSFNPLSGRGSQNEQ